MQAASARVGRAGLALVGLLVTTSGLAVAQIPPAAPPAASPGPLITIDFPDDGIDLSLLADIVTRRLHVPILYDETLRGKKVIIRVPTKVPESSLMGILQSALRLKQLALIDAEQPGWKQIVPAPSLAAVATPGSSKPVDGRAADGPVAEAFLLEHADPTKLADLVRPFLTQPGGSVQAEAGQKVLLVSDYATVVRRVADIVKQLDTASPAVETRFVPLKQAEAMQVATAVTQLVGNRETFQWGSATGSGVYLSGDERSNQIIVVAPPARMDEVVGLIAGMDKSPDLTTRVYRLKTLGPERVDQLIRSLLDPAILKRGYQSGIDRDGQTLAVSATAAVHERIDGLLRELDVPAPTSSNPIQFYKLKNTKAADVLATISGLLGENNTANNANTTNDPAQPPVGTAGAAGAMPQAGGSPTPATPSANQTSRSLLSGNAGASASPFNRSNQTTGATGSADLFGATPAYGTAANASATQSPGVLSVHGKDATVAADVNTNSVIVIGPPPVQQMYADLIHRLDQRRPQVQIECTIVTLDTTDNLSFGIDIGKLGGFDASKLLTLSSFGVSSTNATTGRLTPVGGTGGTFALLSPGIADIVLRTLQTSDRARLVSAPQLLVNDNGIGKLESVSQQPYAVILDASSVQSITSLGGLASAGTSINVEPHISEADYLQLGYSIELSSFTGTAQNGLPPPSEKNSVDSEVTIPDGYTIVVGGLSTHNDTRSKNQIPVLGDIPLLGYLFGNRQRDVRNTTLFVFIKPVILRDDRFEDLKYLSGVAVKSAKIDGDFPPSEPIALH